MVTEFGRPKWARELANIADAHPGKTVGVFVCGPLPLSAELKNACHDWNSTASSSIRARTFSICRLKHLPLNFMIGG